MQAVEGEEAAVQRAALGFEHAHGDADAGVLQFLDAAALHLSKLVDAAYDDPPDALADDEVGAGGRLAVVGAGFERDVHRGLMKQRLVLRAHRSKGVHLGVALAAAHVVALAYDPTFGTHDDRAHHGVGRGILSSVPGQLQAAAHVLFVVL